jgi:hypothetical protein
MKPFVENVFMKKCLIINVFLFVYSMHVFGQQRALSSWALFPSFSDIQHIVGHDGILFCSSQNGLYSFRKGQSINTIDKTEGLSDVSIGAMMYLEETENLLIGYLSGAIDLINHESVKSDLSLLKLDPRMSKTIYHGTINENTAYFASDLGLIEYRTDLGLVQDIFQNIGIGASSAICYYVLFHEGYLYAFCNIGLLKGNISHNLLDYTQWETLGSTPFNQSTKALILDNQLYYTMGSNQLFKATLSGNIQDTITFNNSISEIQLVDDYAYLSSGNEIWEINVRNEMSPIYTSDDSILTFFYDGADLWVSVAGHGLINESGSVHLLPTGPDNDSPSLAKALEDEMVFMDGSEVYSTYASAAWENIHTSTKIVDGVNFLGTKWHINAAGEIFSSTDQSVYRTNNTGIPTGSGTFDQNIWITHSNSNTPLIYSEDLLTWNTISAVKMGSSSLIDPQFSLGGTIYSLNDRSELIAYEPLSNETRTLNEQSGLPTPVLDYAIDHQDVLYIATSSGLYYYPDATFIFHDEEAIAAYIVGGDLLQEDHYSSIAIDAGNRKWLATNDGLWLYEDDLNEQIGHWNTLNSDLPSNQINQLVYQADFGLLWTMTTKGIASLQTDSKVGQYEHRDVKIYPNPISRISGESNIAISGIYADALIKITTISGAYINEIRANGSLASWNLLNRSGNMVQPGVYLFFSSNEEGTNSYVGKVLVQP